MGGRAARSRLWERFAGGALWEVTPEERRAARAAPIHSTRRNGRERRASWRERATPPAPLATTRPLPLWEDEERAA